MSEINRLEKKLDFLLKKKILEENNEDKKVKKFKFNDSKFKSLARKSNKKVEYVLVQYLTQKGQVQFMLSRIVSGNIIVVKNKPHELNPRDMWRHKKYMWYIVREIDMFPVSNRDYDRLVRQGRATPNASVIIKAILGAVQKKEVSEGAKKIIIWILIAIGVGIVAWIFFGG